MHFNEDRLLVFDVTDRDIVFLGLDIQQVVDGDGESSVVLLSKASIFSLRKRLYSMPIDAIVMKAPMIKVQYKKARKRGKVIGNSKI